MTGLTIVPQPVSLRLTRRSAGAAACVEAGFPHDVQEMQSMKGPKGRQLLALCVACDRRSACVADAIDIGAREGIWGGMTSGEVRQLRRRVPGLRQAVAIWPLRNRWPIDGHVKRCDLVAAGVLPASGKLNDSFASWLGGPAGDTGWEAKRVLAWVDESLSTAEQLLAFYWLNGRWNDADDGQLSLFGAA